MLDGNTIKMKKKLYQPYSLIFIFSFQMLSSSQAIIESASTVAQGSSIYTPTSHGVKITFFWFGSLQITFLFFNPLSEISLFVVISFLSWE